MIKVKLQSSVNDIIGKRMAQIKQQQAVVLNAAAVAAAESMRKDIETRIDNPTPFTANAVYRSKASPSKLYSVVMIKDIQAKYLSMLITGGVSTSVKPIPTSWTVDKHGNLPRNASKSWKRGKKYKKVVKFKTKKGNDVVAEIIGKDMYILAVWSRRRRYKARLGSLLANAIKSSSAAIK